MTIDEARELISSPIWPKVRENFLTTGEFCVYPSGDGRRLEYVDADTRAKIDLWLEGIEKAEEWKKVVDGESVRALKAKYPGVYPEVFRYSAYFAGKKDKLQILLKMKFPEVYQLCYS